MMNEGQTAVSVPGPLAVALMTGRPELARLAIMNSGAPLTTEEVVQFSNFAESVVREIQNEREIQMEMYKQIRIASQNITGVLRTFDRIEEAFRLMSQNAGPEAIAQALSNQKSKRNREEQ